MWLEYLALHLSQIVNVLKYDLPLVVCRRAHVLFVFVCVQKVVCFCFVCLRPMSCVHKVASFSIF